MRKLLIGIIAFITVITSFSQELIYKQKDKLKPGVYRNFEEFKTNSPSVEWKYYVKQTTSNYVTFSSSGTVIFGKLVMEKEERKSFGSIYGFCDGKNIFIIPNYKNGVILKRKTSFNKVVYLGRYVYYESFTSVNMGEYGSSKTLDRRFLNINNGDNYSLDKNSLRTVLSQDNDLLYQFENEKRKNKVLKEYLIKYCAKNF